MPQPVGSPAVQIYRSVDEMAEDGPAHAVTIGNYDGVHIGHRAVIDSLCRLAAERGLLPAVVTFYPHPAAVLRPDIAPLHLTDIDHRLELLAECGVAATLVVPFDLERAQETAEEFVIDVLVQRTRAKVVVVGEDFRFGKGREGDVEVLRALGHRHGFEVIGLDLVAKPEAGTESVSSTTIRAAVAAGDLQTATRLLGRPHEVRGVVAEGDRRGRTIGFPTANVAVPRDRAVPADGVYAGWYVRPDGSTHRAAINIGKRPTFYQDAEHSTVEVHLLDFTGDLYGEQARVVFIERIRPEQRFDGVDALVAQLGRDVADARARLDRVTPPAQVV